jgi:hypothetical protein
MSNLDKFVKVEMIRDVPLEQIVDLMDKLEKQLKAKGDEIAAFKERLESELEYATSSSDREDFNIPTRRYWQVKAEALSGVIECMKELQPR